MGSLKEIKTRINSVKSTQKITSAMKMVSSAKLSKAQRTIENFYPYQQKIQDLLQHLLVSANDEVETLYAEKRELKKVAVVVFASNASLCGGFNSSVVKKLADVIANYRHLGLENILIYPVGKQVSKACKKSAYQVMGNFDALTDKPSYNETIELADALMSGFENQEFDKVDLLYYHFNTKSNQELTHETFLPMNADIAKADHSATDYIVEPDLPTVLEHLIPKALRLKVFTALLDSSASEHAARTMAMQIATDNADDILQELSMQYNKSRQQAITNELLDIVGGSMGQ